MSGDQASATSPPMSPSDRFDNEAWSSYHLYYHGDQDAVLVGWVAPMVRSLFAQGVLDRFFYLRYRLGGPHLRLRFRPRAGAHGVVEAALAEMAEQLFHDAPSHDARDPEKIARDNESILRLDRNETDATVYRDNSWCPAPFVPEIERFGGPDLFATCLDIFTASSLATLDFLTACRPIEGSMPSPGQRLAATLQRQAGLAWGLASSPQQWLGLVGYAGRSAPSAMAPIVERGDTAFEQNRSAFVTLVLQALNRADTDISSTAHDAAPTLDQLEQKTLRYLAWNLRHRDAALRQRILTSQLHLGANRLGQSNPDEVYLSRMLWRAAGQIETDAPQKWSDLTDRLAKRPIPSSPLSECLVTLQQHFVTAEP